MAKTRLNLEIDGIEVSVSSPDKIYFPAAKITKLEVIEYYRAVAQAALRGAAGRPLVLKRYVNGIGEQAFYQKRAPQTRPPWLETVTLRFPSGRKAEEVVLTHAASLIWAVNLGCIELHVHPVRATDLDHPDELRIDLDPVPGIEWPQIRDVGFVTREVLTELGLVGWPKTSGSRGLHIYVRIHPKWTFDEVRRAALAIARQVERRAPGRASSRWWKEERQGVFLDYNQNAKDRTIASAWSVRPMADARVSMPLTWSELETADPAAFTLRTAPARLQALGDPHAAMDEAAGDLSATLELVRAHEAEGLGDAAWPPHYAKRADEPTRAQPSRRRPSMPLVEIGRAKLKEDALAGLERWKVRHPEVGPHLRPADVLVDRMRGRHSEWTRVRVNLQNVPDGLRPAQEALDPDYDVASEWGRKARVRSPDVELPDLPGFSEKKLWALHRALGVTSVEELEEAALAGRVQTVKGFGPKTEASILEAITLQRARAGLWLSMEAGVIVRRVQAQLADTVDRLEVAGALRRGVEVVDAVTLVAATGAPGPALDRLAQMPGVDGVEVREAHRVTVRLADGPPVTLICVAEESFGAAWQHATAAPVHLEGLEAQASKAGLRFTADGLYRGGEPVRAPDESSLAERLGLPWIPPELREEDPARIVTEQGERLDALVRTGDLRGMVHCHTTWSDGKNSVEEMARAAQALGFEYITITDHSGSAFYANGVDADRLSQQWDEIDRVQEKVGIRLLKGTESDILIDGSLDFPDEVLERLDVIIASVHSRFKLTEAAMTERLLHAMRLPVFKIWGHPLGRLLLRREPVSARMEAVLDAIAESRAAIEINADPHRLDLPPEYVRQARLRGIDFVVSSDAHSVRGLEVLDFGVAVARRGGLTKDEVLNTRPVEDFLAAVRPG